MGKSLQLWNGRLNGYEHGFVAAYSRADAVRVIEENFGGRGWNMELTVYWSQGGWGNSMIGVTPERGLWAQKSKSRQIVRLVKQKEVIVTDESRGQVYADFKAKQEAESQAFRTAEKTAEAKRAELRELFAPPEWHIPNTNITYVKDAEWSAHKGKYDVVFHGLTEEEVRQLAAKLNEQK